MTERLIMLKYTSSEYAAAAPHPSVLMPIVHELQPPLFKGLAKSEIDHIVGAAVSRKCQRGTILSMEGESAEQFFMLTSGRARYFTLTEDGRRVILRWIVPSEVFGAMAMMQDLETYLVSTELVRDGEVLMWSRGGIRHLVTRYPRLLDNIMTSMADYFRWYVAAHLALVSHSAPQRLARVVARLAKDIGRPTLDGVELDVTNEELADAAHITRFSTSRLLSRWQRNGTLIKRRGKLFLTSSDRLFSYKPRSQAAI